MAGMSLVSSILLLLFCAAAGSSFDDSNPIRLASDGLRDLEAQVLQVVGHTKHAFSFARFAHRCDPAPSLPSDHQGSEYMNMFSMCLCSESAKVPAPLNCTVFAGMGRATRPWRRWSCASRFSLKIWNSSDPPTERAYLTSLPLIVSVDFLFCQVLFFI